MDTTPALAIPGVVDVLTHENTTRLRPADFLMFLTDPAIHFAGQPVALVIAETQHIAKLAAGVVAVTYDELPAVTSMSQGAETFAPKEAARVATDSRRGEPERTLAEAEVAIARNYTTAANNHHPLETHAVVAWWEGEQLTVHTTTQAVFATRRVIAHCFELQREQVRVITRHLGGGFGSKGVALFPMVMLAIMAARRAGRPVRFELTRAQMFTLVGRRQESVQTIKLGASRAGHLTAIVHDTVAQTAALRDYADANGDASRWLYACDNVSTTHRLVRGNVPQAIAMRAPGYSTGTFVLESAIDELANELRLDPLELRRRNATIYDQHTDRPWSSNGLLECYRIGADAFGWQHRPSKPGTLRYGRYRIGWGMASAAYPVHRMAAEVGIRIDRNGKVLVRCGAQDMGTGTYTVLAQLAAQRLGVPLRDVTVELGDTVLPEGPYSGAALATTSFTPAAEDAARQLRERLDELGHVPPDGLEAIARAAPEKEARYSSCAFGAVFVEVCVDSDLGEVRVRRITAAYAAGRILNARLARSQYVGGLVMGIGNALHEETVMDERLGRIVGDNLADYLLPVHADMPKFDIHIVPEQDPHLGGGVKGIGMLGAIGTGAAIANAVFHATGKRIRKLPMRLEDCL
jgi:xanthine dehydrogenase YagR molybdenum-binding subunit